MIEQLNGIQFQSMILHAAANVAAEKQTINDLNVFPVPDGDTGTNMSLTLDTAVAELQKQTTTHIGDAAGICASALLRGARGNSGVILSLLFRGFSKYVKEKERISAADFAAALSEGVTTAYKAVMKPAEGTILTVSRLSAFRAVDTASEQPDVESVLQAAIEEGSLALADTVNQNPVLKKAGVVDAGGKGFLLILQGMLEELQGLPMPETEAEPVREKADFSELSAQEITYTYDTVFTVRKNKLCSLEPLRSFLNQMGDSLVIGEDEESFKVHVHTDHPGEALTEAQKYGTLELAKIENMRTQYEDLAGGRTAHCADVLEPEPVKDSAPEEDLKDYGFVAVCSGEGLARVFQDLGCDRIISGGQTMNPSTEAIAEQIRQTPARTVYVLPNNSNIIMAAQQCVGLIPGRQVHVLPTKTVPQGVSAMLAFDPELDEQTNTRGMQAALSQVQTSEITYAARDSEYDGTSIRRGDYLALCEHQLFAAGPDLTALLHQLAQAQPQQNAEFITIYYGENVDARQAQETLQLFQDACPEAEVTLLDGGQPVYYYMISAE